MSAVKVYLELPEGRLEVAAGETTVGRSHRCDLVVSDPSVSRTHALLSVAGERVRVQDLDSSNGTFVNGRRLVVETEVRDGDELVLGETRMRVRVGEDGGASASPASHRRPADGPSRSEAPAVRDVLPVGEVLASPTDSWETTGPVPLPPGGETEARAASASPTPVPRREPAGDPAEELPPPVGVLDPDRDLPPPSPRPVPSRRSSRPAFLPPAGFWLRSAAALADGLLVLLLAVGASFAAGGPVDRVGGQVASWTLGGLSLLVPLVGWSRWGTTPGKRLFGLYVCELEGRVGIGPGRALLRWIGYAVSTAALGLGFVMAGLTADRRALHDRIAGTYVGRRS